MNMSSVLDLEYPGFEVREEKSNLWKYLNLFGLEDKYPSKITLNEVVRVEINDSGTNELCADTFKEAPWKLLRGILLTHSEARDKTLSKLIRTENSVAEKQSDNFQLSIFDFFHVVLQCCDPTLQNVVFQKLYLCKIAVPFVFTDWNRKPPVVSMTIWPLRFIYIEHIFVLDKIGIKTNVLDLPTKVVAFARSGRPKLSKSKVLNSLLGEGDCKPFFDVDCFSGLTPKTFTNGCIEMFWLPTVGKVEKDQFDTSVTFLNVRGDLLSNCSEDIFSILGNISDTVCVVIDTHCLCMRRQFDLLQDTIARFSSAVLLFTDCSSEKDNKNIHSFCEALENQKSIIKVNKIILADTQASCSINAVKTMVLDGIIPLLKDVKDETLEKRTAKTKCKTDETTESCQHGKQLADNLFKLMKKTSVEKWKSTLCPVQFRHASKLGEKLKQFQRAKCLTSLEKLRDDISEVRRTQIKSVSESVKQFASSIFKVRQTSSVIDSFLGWLAYFIEGEKAKVLPGLLQNYQETWNEIQIESKILDPHVTEIADKETKLQRIESSIDNASFSYEYFFNELGHIYDSYIEQKIDKSEVCLPDIETIADLFAKLIFNGHRIEIVDELGFYMPYKWLQVVFQKLRTYVGSDRIICLSVQGLQSSGKSTLLNTMFGAQFPVKEGKCTRGIQMQLIPVQSEVRKHLPFQYIAILDTEGLRPSDTYHSSHEHDNELATVITGIGDITVINIMGENLTGVNEILQIVVHAFLRLKQTNDKLDIFKSCYFVHHNVQGTLAPQNMQRGMHALMQTLDEMSKVSAQREGVLDVNSFSQVIAFDPMTNVSYLNCLWAGSPPMAKVSSVYTESVASLKHELIHKAIMNKSKSYWTLKDMLTQMHSLWEGVLKEDFVFSYRSSMEIKAEMEMNLFVEKQLRDFNNSVNKECRSVIQNTFAACRQKDCIEGKEILITQQLVKFLNDEKSKILKNVDTYFSKNYKEVAKHWKESQRGRCETLCSKLEKDIRSKIEKQREIRLLEILTNESQKHHEEQLMQESMRVAKDIRKQGRTVSEEERSNEFEKIWASFSDKMNIPFVQYEFPKEKLKIEFINSLKDMFGSDQPLDYLKNTFDKTLSFEHLSNSFEFTNIVESDCGWLYGQESGAKAESEKTVKSKESVIDMLSQFDLYINNLDKVNDYIWEPEVRTLIYDLSTNINEMKRKRLLVCKRTLEIKLCVHVSHFAFQKFNEHNKKHFKNQRQKRLNEYKEQLKIKFEAHLNDRQFEDTFARLLGHILETFARDKFESDIPYKLKCYLRSKCPSDKQSLMCDILKSLKENMEFDDLDAYMQYPERYAAMYMADICNKYLLKEKGYYNEAKLVADDIYESVKEVVSEFVANHADARSLDAQQCIKELRDLLASEDLVIPEDSFRVICNTTGNITNIAYFNNCIMENCILSSHNKLLSDIQRTPESDVVCKAFGPIEDVFKHVRGCREQCPFCWEPCEHSADHTGTKHSCLQHRPLCCTGSQTRNKKVFLNFLKRTNEFSATLETCNFLVGSDISHNCDTIEFKCNVGNNVSCAKQWHKYQDYKRYLSDWYIQPVSDMHYFSMYWLWFVAKYKDFLATKYGYQIGPIPASWEAITSDEAIKSLDIFGTPV